MTDLYRLEVSAAARRQLHQLPERVAAAVVEFITAVLPGNPARLSKPLTGGLEGLRSARRGDYRVLLWIDEDDHRVVVVRVAHRSDAYRSVPPRPADPRERPE
ncbi:MAG: type II toxin-antitoxin system RelE/ParE family toxin [Actinobacteria bacterium]|nr:type II toxin-antitoxin system RelE/ParE family toxin [Actinomycetota bacterium]